MFLPSRYQQKRPDQLVPRMPFSANPSPQMFNPSALPSFVITPPKKTGGEQIDESSQKVAESQIEIDKFRKSLPLTSTITTSTGQAIDVVVDSPTFANSPWLLDAYFSGVDFRIPANSSGYAQAKLSFKEAVAFVSNWIRSQGADPNKIIISWGDRAYIQERGDLWLKE